MTKQDIADLGSAYKQSCDSKLLVYKMAQLIAGRQLEIVTWGTAQQVELESLSNFHVGLLLADDWEVPGIPAQWLAEIHVIPSFGGSLELH